MNPDKAVVLKTYSLLSSAESAAACLKARGMDCVIQADDCGGMLSPLDLMEGIKLVVDAEDEARAREVLSGMMEADTPA
jgi:hypothetical protein